MLFFVPLAQWVLKAPYCVLHVLGSVFFVFPTHLTSFFGGGCAELVLRAARAIGFVAKHAFAQWGTLHMRERVGEF